MLRIQLTCEGSSLFVCFSSLYNNIYVGHINFLSSCCLVLFALFIA